MPQKYSRVVGSSTLWVGLPPVARLTGNHLVVIGGEQRDKSGTADATSQHSIGDVTNDVVDFNSRQPVAVILFCEHTFNLYQTFLERLRSWGFAARGYKASTFRANIAIIKS